MLKSIHALAFAAAAIGLAACSSPEADLDGDLEIGAADPFYWSVDIKRDTGKTIISIVGQPAFEGDLPVRTKGEGAAYLLTSKTPQGDFVMSLTQKECFDGLAEEARPWAVTATWQGEILEGCAQPR
jgi:uncharacterized membrane protein